MAGGVALCAPAAALGQVGAEAYAIKPLRWEEDYSWLAGIERPDGVPAFKYVALGEGAWASFGVEARARVETYDEPLFGLRGASDFVSAQGRLLVHGDVHLTPAVRTFVQLGVADERGREPDARAPDESALDLSQAFVDFGRESGRRLRIGRQELPFGRFLSLRDGTNIRRTFDGARLTGGLGDLRLDGFVARPTRNGPDAFDDDPDPADAAWGVSVSRGGLSAIYFGRRDERSRYAAGVGTEERHTLALRTTGERGPWRWEAQAGVQSGELETAAGALDIRAAGFASEVSRGFDGAWRPRAALRIDAAGGDENPADGTLGTFDLGYPNLAYLSDAAAIAPRNVLDVHPFLTVQPTPQLTLTGGAEVLWRLERGDALYAPPAVALTPVYAGGGRYVGTQWYLRAGLRPDRHWDISLSAVRIDPGPAITRAGGKAQTFAAVQTSLRY
ncbi:MAG: alginate export family protein [Hyphomonadaceae bacterium]|nr:alginate export family protein [Hyphomonadaceae bacterium]